MSAEIWNATEEYLLMMASTCGCAQHPHTLTIPLHSLGSLIKGQLPTLSTFSECFNTNICGTMRPDADRTQKINLGIFSIVTYITGRRHTYLVLKYHWLRDTQC
ncbi:hypothetical protein BJ165DRAFT_1515386 [Panaeolus papilionaceus]|nr:hypothetical protein BJ165DRAFT_1515386 [Panaeolus papilionaceus]